jgi:glycosyltransferase involved in cell wall biosynthesis
MRVLNVASIISAREGGGVAERTVQLTRSLMETGETCAVLTLDIGDPQAQRPFLGGADLIVLPCLNKRFQVPQLQWEKVLELVRQADVIHLVGYWSLLGVIVTRAALKAGVPYVFCPAGALPLFGRSQALKKLFNLLVGYRLVGRASGWVAVTASELPDFETYGVEREKVQVIPNGVVEADFVRSEGVSLRDAKNIGSGPIILFMGRLNLIKGPDLLLEAFIYIAAEFPDVRLVFAGPDEGLLTPLEQRARKAGVSDRVHFVGFLGLQEKLAAYYASSLLVVPSRSEAMSLVAVEGGMCGIPVLMTNQCGLDDVSEIEPGLVVAPTAEALATGLRTALADFGRLRTWGISWRNMIRERFLWRDLGKRFADFLRTVINQERR